jgi:hypothetical protein
MDEKIKAFSAIDRALGMIECVAYGVVEDAYVAAIEDAVGRIADALEVLRCDTT